MLVWVDDPVYGVLAVAVAALMAIAAARAQKKAPPTRPDKMTNIPNAEKEWTEEEWAELREDFEAFVERSKMTEFEVLLQATCGTSGADLEDFDDRMARALALMRRGNYLAAGEQLETVVDSRHRFSIEAMYFLGQIYVGFDESLAIKWLRKAGYEHKDEFDGSGRARAALLTLHRDRADDFGTPLDMHPNEASDWRRAPDNDHH